ncbi:ParB N-terminal domain-containing protein [Luteibacter anthropi]|uniref:plasmid partitioning protein RepB C-terminal domain-containing protein n=1 Tax=Luteibacter anthropi TaxID=564369 RepID=UPI0020326314|nr:plasmid partitioning protein RepB C-terminal domain-containing protein [Luteibacter anthropi]URX62044.1 ParB N-terminal domain-containing protein [Luteibacter anthropi]
MTDLPKGPDESLKTGFSSVAVEVPLERIQALKLLPKTLKNTSKWKEILTSIREEGLVELPVVEAVPGQSGFYYLVDGHVRVEALRELGELTVKCLLTARDDTYTYNTMVNRISAVQDHKMLLLALDAGVPIERLAKALGRVPGTIRRKARLMEGICDEAAAILADTHCSAATIAVLKQLKPVRQMEAVELMMASQNFSVPFAKALLASTSEEMLSTRAEKGRRKTETAAAMARVERELSTLQMKTSTVSEAYGRDVVDLTLLRGHLSQLLGSNSVVKWLVKHRPEYLREFQRVVEVEDVARG